MTCNRQRFDYLSMWTIPRWSDRLCYAREGEPAICLSVCCVFSKRRGQGVSIDRFQSTDEGWNQCQRRSIFTPTAMLGVECWTVVSKWEAARDSAVRSSTEGGKEKWWGMASERFFGCNSGGRAKVRQILADKGTHVPRW